MGLSSAADGMPAARAPAPFRGGPLAAGPRAGPGRPRPGPPPGRRAHAVVCRAAGEELAVAITGAAGARPVLARRAAPLVRT